MANINFSKLNCKVKSEITSVLWNGQNIEVKQYLPIEEKLLLTQEVLNLSISDLNYSNPIQLKVYTAIKILQYYTNIKFTDKQLANAAKLYDLIYSEGLVHLIYDSIPQEELDDLFEGVDNTLKAFYTYRTSLIGILETLQIDYSQLNDKLLAVIEQVKDPEALKLLKEIAPLLGQKD